MDNKQSVGVIVGRFQVKNLHYGHKELINYVCANHKKVILFIGVSIVGNTKNNPYDFATRKSMIQEQYPDIVILPLKDQRLDSDWDKQLDSQIKIPFGECKALLYGGRDSFISKYKGQYETFKVAEIPNISGTESRNEDANIIISSDEFRAGIIYSVYSQRDVTFPTVDVCAYNDDGQILLAKKPNETKYRFIGGFVDRTDTSWEHAAKREFYEEANGSEIGDLQYIVSKPINDWRYNGTGSGIMTTLFLGKFMFGNAKPTDDIAILDWVQPFELNVETDIMPEHQEIFYSLLNYIKDMKPWKS